MITCFDMFFWALKILFQLTPNLSLVQICSTTNMSGRVERKINDNFYFVVDEVGGSSDIESESYSDDETMSNSKDEAASAKKYVSGDNSNVLVGSDVENEVKGDRIDNGAENSCKQDGEIICIKSAELDISGGESISGMNDKKSKNNSICSNTESVSMDIDNDSDGEIEWVEEEAMEPIIKISFRDERIEKLYKSSILKFLTQKIHSCTVIDSSINSLEIQIYDEKSGKVEDKDVLDFHLDTTPNFDSRTNRVPSYGKNHDVLLSDSPSEKTKTRIETGAPVCFNCCGNHVLRDCPHERNIKEIAKNRNKFQQSANKMQNKARRYHLDENQRYGDLVPGELTKNLRNALDLQKDQQPLFIYRMRLFGYPPAWLEEARVSHSGVVIYDSNGVPISEEDEEEGEIIPEGAKDRFDISKIIEFPGFNVPLQKNMKEEGKHHFCPALSEEQSKENMIKNLQPNAVQAYKKRSLTLQKYSSQKANSQRAEKRLSSPTIEEMEEKKRQLLMALNDEDLPYSAEKAVEQTEKIENDKIPHNAECIIEEKKCESPEIKNVKTLDYGTPILKSISPYSRLPSREQFSVNVSDVIHFENLPNSTGKYESMSSLIHKIRKTVTRIQNE